MVKNMREPSSIRHLRLSRRSPSLIIAFTIWRTIEITVFSPMSENIVNTHARLLLFSTPSYPLFKIGNVSDQKHKKTNTVKIYN